MRADVAIVGGGPAGLATAIRAAELGLSTLVLERRALPLDKACGEGLMPPGVEALEALGVTIPQQARHPFVGIRFIQGPIQAEGEFPRGAGLGIRRTVLIEALVARARALGVELRYGTGVRSLKLKADSATLHDAEGETHEARRLIGADGLHSMVRTAAGLSASPHAFSRPRYGVRRHFALAPWSPHVEVHWGPRSEAYVTPVSPTMIGVAILWRGGGGGFEEQLQTFPALAERLHGAATLSEAAGAGPFSQRVPRRTRGPVSLVGDAAGYSDALTGEGVSLALLTGRRLAELIHEGAPARAYEAEYHRLTASYYRTTRLFLAATRTAELRRRLIPALARRPKLFAEFLAINLGERPLWAVGLGGAIGLLGELVRPPPRPALAPRV